MKRKRILLVDDDLELLKRLAKRCQKLGLEVYSAHDALQAVTLLEEKDPDLLCLSGSIPGGNGMRLCEMVLASPDDVACPVIVLTQNKENTTPRQSAEMCVYHVQKRPQLWKYLEPVIYELIDIQPAGRRSTGGERGRVKSEG
ncbi:MAG: response regulator [Pirellulaceae bacterium]